MILIASGTGRCHAPELTRIAFISAFVAGADGFRLPPRRTSDKRVVVFEDATIDRLTGTAGAVSDLTLKQLRILVPMAGASNPAHTQVANVYRIFTSLTR
jgi:glycerophosphoryl diester phosphodiesterase